MTAISPIDLREAEVSVAVANTPIFLAKRLRNNVAVKTAHDRFGGEALLAALRQTAHRNPASITEATEVYFYLVALSFSTDLKPLRAACEIRSPIKWYSEIGEYLLETAYPLTVSRIQIPATLSARPTFSASTANSTPILIGV